LAFGRSLFLPVYLPTLRAKTAHLLRVPVVAPAAFVTLRRRGRLVPRLRRAARATLAPRAGGAVSAAAARTPTRGIFDAARDVRKLSTLHLRSLPCCCAFAVPARDDYRPVTGASGLRRLFITRCLLVRCCLFLTLPYPHPTLHTLYPPTLLHSPSPTSKPVPSTTSVPAASRSSASRFAVAVRALLRLCSHFLPPPAACRRAAGACWLADRPPRAAWNLPGERCSLSPPSIRTPCIPCRGMYRAIAAASGVPLATAFLLPALRDGGAWNRALAFLLAPSSPGEGRC